MKTKMKNETIAKILQKKNHILIWGILLVILIGLGLTIYFFSQNVNKNLNLGNNLNKKTNQEIEEYILNISSYEAEIEVTIESNKNTNKYVLLQKYISQNKFTQTVLEPSNIEGLEIKYEDNKLSINNTKLNLTTVFENYEYLANNYLCLETFISEYKTGKTESKSTISEENNEFILKVDTKTNQYIYSKQLYISKETAKPIKLLINDINEKTLVYILYNEIEINDLE